MQKDGPSRSPEVDFLMPENDSVKLHNFLRASTQESDQKVHLFEVLEDRFSHRLEVAIFGVRDDMTKMESSIRQDMNNGFLEVAKQFTEIGKQFTDVHKEISGIHKAISAQTKWLLIAMLAGITLYPVIQKFVDKF